MIELPEALTLARQLNDALAGKTIAGVLPPTRPHKFCWWSGDPAGYEASLLGARFSKAEGFGIFVELGFNNGQRLCINDGVNVRLVREDSAPKDYQLLIRFDDGAALCLTVAMYGGIVLHDGTYDNEYYLKSRAYISPFSNDFKTAFFDTLAACKPTVSAKAFLATEQRFPGIGNGVLQDILFSAGIHPKRKLATLSRAECEKLYASTVSTLENMTALGGRDTEKDIFNRPGGYVTRMSKNTLTTGCPVCSGPITKEAYMGGSVYYCAACQPLVK